MLMNKPMKKETVYYAHSKCIYNTPREKSELKWLRKKFAKVLDPNSDMGELGDVNPYLRAVGEHDAVVCSEYKGYIGKGVYHEVDHALRCGRKVWCLRKRLGVFYLKPVKKTEFYDGNDWKVCYAKLVI